MLPPSCVTTPWLSPPTTRPAPQQPSSIPCYKDVDSHMERHGSCPAHSPRVTGPHLSPIPLPQRPCWEAQAGQPPTEIRAPPSSLAAGQGTSWPGSNWGSVSFAPRLLHSTQERGTPLSSSTLPQAIHPQEPTAEPRTCPRARNHTAAPVLALPQAGIECRPHPVLGST